MKQDTSSARAQSQPMQKGIEMLDWEADQLFSLSPEETLKIQLAAAREKFHEMVDRIPVLKNLAEKQGVSDINTVEDLAKVLFSHMALKSYSMSVLENGRFDQLTAWLNKLTTCDLSSVDANQCQTIDEWLLMLERDTPLRIAHSTGTSGKVSFFPRSAEDSTIYLRAMLKTFEGVGNEEANRDLFRNGDDLTFTWLSYRKGNSVLRWFMDEFVDHVTGSEDSVIALYPGALSVDLVSLNGRMRTAEAGGRLNELKISPALLARREEFLEQQKQLPQKLREFVDLYADKYSDKRTILFGFWYIFLQLKSVCEEKGIRQLFRPDSLISCGGGAKGYDLPADYVEQVKDFLGVDQIRQNYGMTEMTGWTRQCPQGKYHIPPYTMPIVLHEETGDPLPRKGTQSGRMAFFDLLAQTYWGGFVSGDEVTIEWDQPCSCGRGNPYLTGTIQRYSEKQAKDDKITCSGAPKAHEDALNFLASIERN